MSSTPPIKPQKTIVKTVKKIKIDFFLLKISFTLIIVGLCSYGLFIIKSGFDKSLIGYLLLAPSGLAAIGVLMLFDIFSIEEETKYIKKKPSQLLKEQKQYDKDYEQYLKNYSKNSRQSDAERIENEAKKKKRLLKEALDETYKRDKARRLEEEKRIKAKREEEEKNKKALQKKRLDEADKRDKARREEEEKKVKATREINDEIKKALQKYRLDAAEKREKARREEEEKKEKELQKNRLNDSKINFKPIAGINFSISANNENYHWYALYKYYPVNRFSASDLSPRDLEVRRLVFDFKDGRNVEYCANLFASALINVFGRSYLNNKTLLIVPASNKAKTEVRFKEFCRLFSAHTGLTNGYHMLNNNGLARNPANRGGNRNIDLEDYLAFSGSFNAIHLIVIDDVRTSGSSSNKIYEMLRRRNIASVTFFYMAKTVSI
jgi:hypothetical protein